MIGKETKAKVAVFVSGTGSNLKALANRQKTDVSWPAEVAAVVSDKPSCAAVKFAETEGIPVFARELGEFASRAEFEKEVLSFLRKKDVQYIVLAGYMRVVKEVLLAAFPRRILNIHPSLLPNFPGRHAVEDAYNAGVAETGVTIHFVDAGIDTGPIIAQQPVAVHPEEDIEILYQRIHAVEHQLYGDVLAGVIERDKTKTVTEG